MTPDGSIGYMGEEGDAPDRIVASRFDAAGNLLRQRPLCPYPAKAVYKGGDVDSADRFRCAMPRPSDRTIIEPGDLLHIRNALTRRDVKLPNR